MQLTSLAIDKYPAPDKERTQLLWVAHMNGLKVQAEEEVVERDHVCAVKRRFTLSIRLTMVYWRKGA